MKTIKLKISLLLVFVILSLQSCGPVRLISEYDEITDNMTTEIQKKISGIFVKIERNIGTSKAEYTSFIDQYDEARVLVNTLEVRANSIEKNEKVQNQVSEIITMLDKLEKLHKLKFGDSRELKVLKDGFNQAFSAIIKLQTGLKRDKTKNK